MIGFIGDVHRAFDRLAGAVAAFPANVDVAIQVGDLGLHPDDLSPTGPGLPPLAHKVYYVTGNHDHEPSYRGITRPTEMRPTSCSFQGARYSSLLGDELPFLGADPRSSTGLCGGMAWTGGRKKR